ncbi:MAG: YggS family pyridoxal phosphate-dependent enzyme [Anaerolineaceae bacterium]
MSEPNPEVIQTIKQRLEIIESNVTLAAEKSKRIASDVLILAVSKRQPLSIIEAAYACGVRCFGENYAEEADEKIKQLSHLTDIRWEMVGHVQSRKSALVAEDFSRVHSLDSLKLARRLNSARASQESPQPLEVLLQLNVSGESSKEGLPAWEKDQWEGLLPIVSEILSLWYLRLTGLMTMPPLFDDPERTRPFFQRLRQVRDFLNQQIPGIGLTELSMGTSADYSVAVEEGATIIRIGQALLGPRIYPQGN